MSESFEQTEQAPEEFEPSEATIAAWEAREHMLVYRDSEPGSMQGETALAAAHTAFEHTIKGTESFLRRSLVGRTGGDLEGTSEILQETYLRAYKYLHTFRGDSQVETWLHRIAFRQLSTYYKKRSKYQSDIALDPLSEDEEGRALLEHLTDSGHVDVEAVVEQREEVDLVLNAIANLRPRHRAVVELAYLYNRSHEQIAEILGITVTNSKVRLHRAREKLQRARGSGK